MTDKPEATERIHNEAPAEGDLDADPTDLRMHSQDPAEGADFPNMDFPTTDTGQAEPTSGR
ncbi:hypothetical protein F8G81_21135 [Arthrobacter sp. CDRTa11]|uniref:hypothetical protein n=1 Tax=Arthrobacter sp. CDRTa11 TaxID=2651199 RepID=UPI0022659E23|nr:hypothetical protein [Arthrobacter sp. CDRTa11]UZX04813.1 hypothetical protein F8G81_21135 [Arthrobacter sp. CDRTa11]